MAAHCAWEARRVAFGCTGDLRLGGRPAAGRTRRGAPNPALPLCWLLSARPRIWPPSARSYFDELSRTLATTRATVEIEGPDLGAQVQADDLILSGISYDDRDEVLVIGLSPGGPAESLQHFVSGPRRITVESSDEGLPASIEVEDGEGQRTLVQLKPAPALAAILGARGRGPPGCRQRSQLDQ